MRGLFRVFYRAKESHPSYKNGPEEMKFVPENCNESSAREDALKRHERRHQEVATHPCGNSLKEFYRRDKFIEDQIF